MGNCSDHPKANGGPGEASGVFTKNLVAAHPNTKKMDPSLGGRVDVSHLVDISTLSSFNYRLTYNLPSGIGSTLDPEPSTLNPIVP